MHFSSYHNEEAADLSPCLYNEKIVSFFSIGSGSLPKHKQKKHDQIFVDGDTNGVTHDRVLVCQQNIFFSFSMHEESTSFCIYPFTLSTQLPPHELYCIPLSRPLTSAPSVRIYYSPPNHKENWKTPLD